jgi:hypothetical protein
MLSNYYIANAIPRTLADDYSTMEMDLVLAVSYFLARTDLRAMPYDKLMAATAELRNEIQVIGAKQWVRTQGELSRTMQQAAERHLYSAEKIFMAGAAAGLLRKAPPLAESVAMNVALAQNYRQAANRLYQIHTRALNVPMEALQNAFFGVQSGALSLQEAVKHAVNDLAERGIAVALYPGGRQMELSSYVRMVTRTSVTQSANELAFLRMDEYGCDLLVVSAHAGARPLCAPFQGRVFSRSGTHPRFPAWASTSYGDPAGLLGINCGHFVDPFVEGLDRVPTAEERDPAKHELGRGNAEWYRLSQEQRYYERKIREWGRKSAAFEEAGLDSSRARAKVREWKGEMQNFIDTVGRTRRPDRERVA